MSFGRDCGVRLCGLRNFPLKSGLKGFETHAALPPAVSPPENSSSWRHSVCRSAQRRSTLGAERASFPRSSWYSAAERRTENDAKVLSTYRFSIDPAKTYLLAELVDLAEEHNPETRLAWERARAGGRLGNRPQRVVSHASGRCRVSDQQLWGPVRKQLLSPDGRDASGRIRSQLHCL